MGRASASIAAQRAIEVTYGDSRDAVEGARNGQKMIPGHTAWNETNNRKMARQPTDMQLYAGLADHWDLLAK
jgi:hypothetical protein